MPPQVLSHGTQGRVHDLLVYCVFCSDDSAPVKHNHCRDLTRNETRKKNKQEKAKQAAYEWYVNRAWRCVSAHRCIKFVHTLANKPAPRVTHEQKLVSVMAVRDQPVALVAAPIRLRESETRLGSIIIRWSGWFDSADTLGHRGSPAYSDMTAIANSALTHWVDSPKTPVRQANNLNLRRLVRREKGPRIIPLYTCCFLTETSRKLCETQCQYESYSDTGRLPNYTSKLQLVTLNLPSQRVDLAPALHVTKKNKNWKTATKSAHSRRQIPTPAFQHAMHGQHVAPWKKVDGQRPGGSEGSLLRR